LSEQHALFEVSFEVCNKVGGIYTVLATKAQTLTERFGDNYVCVGPWQLHDDEGHPLPFEKESGFEEFEASCRAAGLPVQVGRWSIPGRPRTVLIEFSGLYEKKDDVLAQLWEHDSVDSLQGEWDYVEPVLFGHAAAQVIERWWEEFHAPAHRRAVAQFHEWMTGSGLLYLKQHCPGIGTVFTTHATMLGRALSSLGRSPEDGLGDDTPEQLAVDHGVVAKHSIEGVCARESDVFTTVSVITADEAELLHGRRPDPLLLNGIDLEVVDALAGETTREETRARLESFASAFLGESAADSVFLAVSGRYEFHNKGIDVLLDSLADIGSRPGRDVVLFVLVPAGNSGMRASVRERLGDRDNPEADFTRELGTSTHNLFDSANDPVQQRCRERGLTNARGSRVKVIQVPIYLSENDDFLQVSYEAVLRAMDLTAFPSYYEPWGYTPQESLAVGVPTITTDYAGFGRWALAEGLGPDSGITVLVRHKRTYEEVRGDLSETLEGFLREMPDRAEMERSCRKTADLTSWSGLVENYETAFRAALDCVQSRLEAGVPLIRRPKHTLRVRGESQAPRLTRFDVAASLPDALLSLAEIAKNYAWSWDPEGKELFEELSPDSWRTSGYNPIVLLRKVFREDLERCASDDDYLAKVERVAQRMRDYLRPEETLQDVSIGAERPVAYFSAEFGIHESLRIYSGGLGVLSGDHLKSASDLGLPLVGVGLFYGKGYMKQRLTADGEQLALDHQNDPRDLPLEVVRTPEGEELELKIGMPGRTLYLRAWRVNVGLVPLYLLDSDIPANLEEDRTITLNLYGGDETMRIRQEIALGRGGARLLQRLGIRPSAWHMNEGHAAFSSLERVARLVRDEGLTFEEAREVVRATTAFTTHTPVPAGHDRFSEDLMRSHFSDVAEWVGVPWERFLELGKPTGDRSQSDFNMTCLALEFASVVNGVSRLHGEVSRALLKDSWPSLIEQEIPVGSVTNGIHLPTWVRPSIAALVGAKERHVQGIDFQENAPDIELGDLWAARREAKSEMLQQVRENLDRRFVECHDSPVLLARILDGLDEDALWIGFARRFAPYKRAHLLFQDKDRLRALLDSEDRPVRILVAGKAHPRDGRGQEILRDIALIARSDEFVGRVILLEDYDVGLARHMVQGVDVWLNTPTRPLEASGTSGMKAAANGVLNLSIADGWWPEGADGKNGWTIGGERTYDDQNLQDQLDSETLTRLLEEEVVPLYFDCDASGMPTGWLERSRHALATLPHVFNTNRMVMDYLEGAYAPLASAGVQLAADGRAAARARAGRKSALREHFAKVQVTAARVSDLSHMRAGEFVEVHLEIALGELTSGDVQVELVLGHAGENLEMIDPQVVPLRLASETGDKFIYEGEHKLERSGAYAYGLRVRASANVGDPGDVLRDLVRWVE